MRGPAAQHLPETGELPQGALINLFVEAMRSGNRRNEAQPRLGLLSADGLLEVWLDMGLSITPKEDLGFWNRQHSIKKVEAVVGQLMKKPGTIKAALFIQTSFTIAVVFYRKQFLFSTAMEQKKALIAASSRHATAADVATDLSSYMGRQFGCRCTSPQLTFVQLNSSA